MESATTTTTNFAPVPVSNVAGRLAQELFEKHLTGVVPETDKEQLVAVVTVSVDYHTQPKG